MLLVTAETCHCPKYLSTSVRSSPLTKGRPGEITDVIAKVIKKACGVCKEHGGTELNISNSNDKEPSLRFPISLTTPRGSKSSKFVAVLEVPGVLVIKRRGDKSIQRYYEKVMTDSLLDTFLVIILSLLMVYAAGVIIWFLVSSLFKAPN